MQRTLIIFKPDCVQRRLVGAILQRFETKGLRIAALKLIRVDRALGEMHYAEHKGKPFFEGLISFITSAPVVVGVLEGNEAITVVRTMLGATNGAAAAPGTRSPLASDCSYPGPPKSGRNPTAPRATATKTAATRCGRDR